MPLAENCANCATALAGRYCAQCGQDSHTHRLPARALLADAADQLLSVDSRVLRTLSLLVCAPGELTREYIAGRHQPYVPSLRLYLFITIAFFVALSMAGIAILQLVPYDPKTEPPASFVSTSNEVAGTVAARFILFRPFVRVTLTESQRASLHKMQTNLEAQDVASAAIGDRLVHVLARAYSDSVAFNLDIQAWVGRFLLLMMPLFAVAAAVLRPGRFLFVDHLTFALHFHSFLFILLFGAVAVAAFVQGQLVLWLVLLVLALYLFLSLRRAYGLSFVAAGWRAIVLFGGYSVAFVNGLQALILLAMGS